MSLLPKQSRLQVLVSQYDAAVRNAARTNQDNAGSPSKKEAEYYNEAYKLCKEIAGLYAGYDAAVAKWNGNGRFCLEKTKEILMQINPEYRRQQEERENARRAAELRETVTAFPETPVQSALELPPQPAAFSAPPLREQTPPEMQTPAEKKSEPKARPNENRTLTTTASGFSTYNANGKDVPAEKIESWYLPQPPRHDFSNVTGMEKEKAILQEYLSDNEEWRLTNEALGYDREYCYFFYGLPGTGKTYLIEAFICELMKKGWKCIQLKGGDIHSGLVGVAEKIVKAAFNEAIDNAPCVIFIDEFDAVCKTRDKKDASNSATDLTVAFLQEFSAMTKSDAEVLLLGATNFPDKIDNAMLDRISPVCVSLPNPEARADYFRSQLRNIAVGEDISYEYMGKVTGNYSYRDLDKIKAALKRQFRECAKEENAVLNESGEIDIQPSDRAVSQAIREGKAVLTRELFDQVKDRYKPSFKSTESLDAFEERFRRVQEEGV